MKFFRAKNEQVFGGCRANVELIITGVGLSGFEATRLSQGVNG